MDLHAFPVFDVAIGGAQPTIFWVDLRAGLRILQKIKILLPLTGFEPRIVHPVAYQPY